MHLLSTLVFIFNRNPTLSKSFFFLEFYHKRDLNQISYMILAFAASEKSVNTIYTSRVMDLARIGPVEDKD